MLWLSHVGLLLNYYSVVDCNSLAMQIASVFSKSVVLSFHPNAEKKLKGFIVFPFWYLIHSGLTSMW